MKKIKHYVKEILFFLITMTILANVISIYRSQDLTKAPLAVDSFKLIDNSTYIIPKNKPILIHFWATWCPVCKLEASNINLLSKSYQVITIAVQSGSNQEIKKYMYEHNYNFKVVNDKDGFLAQKFNIAGYPTTFIYDKNKNLYFSDVGYTSSFALWLRLLLADL